MLLDGFPEGDEDESRQLAMLPMRMGGLGLRAAVRCAPAAYCASWSDALHMISSEDTRRGLARCSRDSATRDHCKGVRVSCAPQHPSWTAKASGGDLVLVRATRGETPSVNRDP